jgi:putative restriction endonuclease
VGVRPDYVIQVRPDILDERDGPTLVHGIQSLHGARIFIPRDRRQRPDRHSLESRYERFMRACA